MPDNVHQLHVQCAFSYCTWQRPPTTRPTTFHVWKTRGCHCSFRLPMMGGVSLETCWASHKYEIIKFWYIVASLWIFLYEESIQIWGSRHQSTKFHSLPQKSRRKKRIYQSHGAVEHNRDLYYRHAPKYCHEPFFCFIRSDLEYCASHCGRYCHLPSVTRVGWTTLTSSRVILHVICILIIYSSRFWSSVASSWSDLVTEQCTQNTLCFLLAKMWQGY